MFMDWNTHYLKNINFPLAHTFSAIPVKLPTDFRASVSVCVSVIIHNSKIILSLYMKEESAKALLNVGGLAIPDVKIFHKAVVIKTVVLPQSQTVQRNRRESPETNSHIYGNLTYDKAGHCRSEQKG